MNITDQRSFDLNRSQREGYIAGYSAMIEENMFGRVPHYKFHVSFDSWQQERQVGGNEEGCNPRSRSPDAINNPQARFHKLAGVTTNLYWVSGSSSYQAGKTAHPEFHGQ